MARAGHPTYVSGTLPTSKQTAKKPKPEVYPLLLEKLNKFITRDYFSFPPPKQVTSYIDMFQVTKGTDIRPVFNGLSTGLNAAVWPPSFQLPTSNSMVNILNYGYKAMDSDL